MQAVPFSARQHAAQLFLVGSGEIEFRQISAGIDFLSSDADKLVASGYNLIDRFLRIDVFMCLVGITDAHGVAYFERAVINLFLPHDELEESCLSGAVRTDDANNAIRRQGEVEIIEQQLVAKGFGHMMGFDDLVAQTRTVRDEDFQLGFAFFLVFVQQLLVRVQARLSFGLACLGSHIDPFQLAFECLASFAGLLFFLCHAFGLLFQPRRIVSFPGNAFAAV